MDAVRWQRIGEIFDRVAERAPQQRARYLDELCGSDAALREEVAALLNADERAAGFERHVEAIRARAAEDLVDAHEAPLRAGDRIGPWRLMRVLGNGGMGLVWLAERADGQFDQRAAIKITRRGTADAALHQRFLHERQILARLDHPHIARLFDGGIAGDGRPYFAMEFVDGRPLLEHCDAERLGLEHRLALFADVCSAVQFAHNQLVIHSDIKPSNILVSHNGNAKLLDFGIARLLQGGFDSTRLEAALTFDYAAPEQRRGEPVGTTADVYALGVVLHELAFGCRPLPAGAESAGTGTQATVRAQDLPIRWRDLAWIIARALQADPLLRYATVQALADDVERLVAARPVLAHPDSSAYRLRRFASRHRVGVAASLAATLALLLASALAVWQAREKTREAAVARQVTEFVVGLFRAADPALAAGPAVTAQDLLDRGKERLGGDPSFDASVRADLLQTLARTYTGLGLYDRALPLAQQALALRRVAPAAATLPVAESMHTLGNIYRLKADYDQSEPLLRDALRLRRSLLGDGDPSVIESLDELAAVRRARGDFAQADTLFGEAVRLAERAFGADAVETARYLDDYAANLDDLGRHAEAGDGYRRALAIREARLGPDSADVATSLLDLGNHLDQSEDFSAATPLLERALRIRRHVFGPDHPLVGNAQLGLASVYDDAGRLEEAERSAEDAARIFRSVLPESHPKVAESLNMLGVIRVARRDFAGAVDILRDVVARYRRTFGEDHPDTLAAKNNLAFALGRTGALAQAEALQRDVLARVRSDNGQDTIAFDCQNLASTLLEEGKFDEAVSFDRRALEIRLKEDGDPSVGAAVALRSLGHAEARAGVAVAAERDLRAALAMNEKTVQRDAAYAFAIVLADLLVGQGRCAEAAPLLANARAQLQEAAKPNPMLLPESELLLGACDATASGDRRKAIAQLQALPGIEVDLEPTAARLLRSATVARSAEPRNGPHKSR